MGTFVLAVTIVMVILAIAAEPAILPFLLKDPLIYAWILWWVVIFFALRTIWTLKPSYMQAFMIVFFVAEIISLADTWLFWDHDHKPETKVRDTLGLIWGSFINYQYYRYVRDRQLEIEERQLLPEHAVTYRV
ncbi:unnamed protein product, partial [Mesorhabditis spiculigera]